MLFSQIRSGDTDGNTKAKGVKRTRKRESQGRGLVAQTFLPGVAGEVGVLVWSMLPDKLKRVC